MKRTFISLSLIALFTVAAMSKPAYVSVFSAKYSPKKDSKVATARCGVCHVGVTAKLNPYGNDLKAAGSPVTAATLAKVESKDSDGDGVKNGAEIKAGTLPGDKGSK